MKRRGLSLWGVAGGILWITVVFFDPDDVSVELSQEPVDEDWQQGFADTVRGLSGSTDFPTIAANHAALADSVFTLRWHTGRERPLDGSFEVALGAWLAGLDALRTPPR